VYRCIYAVTNPFKEQRLLCASVSTLYHYEALDGIATARMERRTQRKQNSIQFFELAPSALKHLKGTRYRRLRHTVHELTKVNLKEPILYDVIRKQLAGQQNMGVPDEEAWDMLFGVYEVKLSQVAYALVPDDGG
jgi:hypothetical protein